MPINQAAFKLYNHRSRTKQLQNQLNEIQRELQREKQNIIILTEADDILNTYNNSKVQRNKMRKRAPQHGPQTAIGQRLAARASLLRRSPAPMQPSRDRQLLHKRNQVTPAQPSSGTKHSHPHDRFNPPDASPELNSDYLQVDSKPNQLTANDLFRARLVVPEQHNINPPSPPAVSEQHNPNSSSSNFQNRNPPPGYTQSYGRQHHLHSNPLPPSPNVHHMESFSGRWDQPGMAEQFIDLTVSGDEEGAPTSRPESLSPFRPTHDSSRARHKQKQGLSCHCRFLSIPCNHVSGHARETPRVKEEGGSDNTTGQQHFKRRYEDVRSPSPTRRIKQWQRDVATQAQPSRLPSHQIDSKGPFVVDSSSESEVPEPQYNVPRRRQFPSQYPVLVDQLHSPTPLPPVPRRRHFPSQYLVVNDQPSTPAPLPPVVQEFVTTKQVIDKAGLEALGEKQAKKRAFDERVRQRAEDAEPSQSGRKDSPEQEELNGECEKSTAPLGESNVAEELREIDDQHDDLFSGPSQPPEESSSVHGQPVLEVEQLQSKDAKNANEPEQPSQDDIMDEKPAADEHQNLEKSDNVEKDPTEHHADAQKGDTAAVAQSSQKDLVSQWYAIGANLGIPPVALNYGTRRGGDDMERRAEKVTNGSKSKGKNAAGRKGPARTDGQKWLQTNRKVLSISAANAGMPISDPEAAAALQAALLPEKEEVPQSTLPRVDILRTLQSGLQSGLITNIERKIVAWRDSGITVHGCQFKLRDATGEQVTESEIRKRYKNAKEKLARLSTSTVHRRQIGDVADDGSQAHDGQAIEFNDEYSSNLLPAEKAEEPLPRQIKPSVRPSTGGKQMNNAAVKAYYEELRKEQLEEDERQYEEECGFSREDSPITDPDAYHWVYRIERKTWAAPGADAIPTDEWLQCGQKNGFTSVREANTAASKEAGSARFGIGPGTNYRKSLIEWDSDGLYNHVIELQDGSGFCVRVQRQLRLQHEGIKPDSKLGWYKKTIYLIHQRTTTTTAAEDSEDPMFAEHVTKEVNEEVLDGAYTILGQANKDASDRLLNVECGERPRKIDDINHREARRKALAEALEALEGSSGLFRERVEVKQKGTEGVTVEVEVWVEAKTLVGPRNF
ncbi:hypothetical protein NA57DRAFT_74337 [Rhizodiscina lignyota]|uniref:Uncharacterized protein n=1 Tax=Rhizodiscina lignyota TaxID=1504668 RepID=A0A9P4IGS9_9PEZI|nr:hypothetical protein NA57DRAFT_74337 [Rhizodiscina lignyota]